MIDLDKSSSKESTELTMGELMELAQRAGIVSITLIIPSGLVQLHRDSPTRPRMRAYNVADLHAMLVSLARKRESEL